MDLNYSKKITSLGKDWRILLWNFAIVLLSVPLLAKKVFRFYKGKDLSELEPQRWTLSDVPATAKEVGEKHVVFAGASYGEMLLIERLSNLLRASDPGVRISWLLRDKPTLEFVREHHPEQNAYLWPFDFIVPVDKMYRSLKPDVLVLMERFRFPNLVAGAAHHSCTVVLVNGRLRNLNWLERTFLGGFYRWQLRSLDVALMQTEGYAKYAREIAGHGLRVCVAGDIKEELLHIQTSSATSADLRTWLSQAATAPILGAGSTDGSQEEAFVLDAFESVTETHPAKLLLAPRRLDRVGEVLEAVRARGLSYSLRSEGDSSGDVLILDTLGELAQAYGSTVAAYVGGSFDGMGHNVLEPLVYGIPVSYGMRRGHFGEHQMRCEEYGVGFRVGNSGDLSSHWVRVLEDESFTSHVREQAKALLANSRNPGQITTQLLHGLLESGSAAAAASPAPAFAW